ncbi:MAG: helix-turn-helix transcriptional regulator [Candidatus Micrarchaeota archaeon]|nr:helix-turn-helix transcriptional regulator [Candidatus Micrarchaeota archaeon]MDE1848122.1 helix-turn-helix transcriptional regulator [Candidatus Micrarchaeota archaeon]MDE1863929.1 helix-turn-helix transcriptional regulator [Candidatus Micrarchaeota archaeon]
MRNMKNLELALAVMATKHEWQVMCCMIAGQSRFNEIMKSCGDMNQMTLSRTLRLLEGGGMIEKKKGKIFTAYAPTKLGRRFSMVLKSMEAFGGAIPISQK